MIQIANAPCSWGVLEFDLEGEAAGFEQVLDEIRETGYAGTELGDWGFMPTDPNKLAEVLEARELALLGAFVPVAWTDSGMRQEALEVALRTATLMKDAGSPEAFIVLADDNGSDPVRTAMAGRVTAGEGWSNDQWAQVTGSINAFAGGVREQTGLRSVFHHHAAGFIETPDEIGKLMDGTDPDLVGLVLDMGHYMFGGGDPLPVLQAHGDRIWHVHFKDCHEEMARRSRDEAWDYFESVKQGVFCKLGEGGVDFPAIVAELKRQ
ncbi:MAG: sugar phosphate isomerase/epimerase family protein, partial [Verrucomicrobiales bacterium]